MTQDRIYGWRESQLSVARFYGQITIQGESYVIDFADPKQPLVKWSALKKERAEAKKKQSTEKAKTLELFDGKGKA